MNTHYQPFHQQAQDLQYRMHDVLSNRNHPRAQVLHQQAIKLREEIEEGKPPRDIEYHIRNIERLLHEDRVQNDSVISSGHFDELHDRYRDMGNNVRHLPHY